MRARLSFAAAATFLVLPLVIVSGCGGSSGSSPTSPTTMGASGATADVTITIVGMNGAQSFSPNPATVRVGQTVAWRNADSVTHTATASGVFDTGSIGRNATSAPITMRTAGSVAYLCAIHPSMTGTLNVTP